MEGMQKEEARPKQSYFFFWVVLWSCGPVVWRYTSVSTSTLGVSSCKIVFLLVHLACCET